MSDPDTIRFYDAAAARMGRSLPAAPEGLAAFIAALPQGARVLDLGCGHGAAAARLAQAGFAVTGLDPSAGLLSVAQDLAPGARFVTGGFDDLPDLGVFAAIWCNFALLHAPHAEMPRHLAAMAGALEPGGLLFLSMLEGEGALRDARGLAYSFVTASGITARMAAAGFTAITCQSGHAPAAVEGRGTALRLMARRAAVAGG